jgi:hypothetical protein
MKRREDFKILLRQAIMKKQNIYSMFQSTEKDVCLPEKKRLNGILLI